jgi:hypothetical protein
MALEQGRPALEAQGLLFIDADEAAGVGVRWQKKP